MFGPDNWSYDNNDDGRELYAAMRKVGYMYKIYFKDGVLMSTPIFNFPLRISVSDDFKWVTDYQMTLDPENPNRGIRKSKLRGNDIPPYEVFAFLGPLVCFSFYLYVIFFLKGFPHCRCRWKTYTRI